MRAIKIVLLATGIVFAMTASLWAHDPNANYFAIGFPPGDIPTMDGDLTDWDSIPEAYWVTMVDAFEETRRGVGTDFDLDDLNIKLIVGWSPSTNRIYGMAWVSDNYLQANLRAETAVFNYDDESHFVVDADHSGGPIFHGEGWADLTPEEQLQLQGRTGQLYSMIVPPIDGYYHWMYLGGWWLTQSGLGTCCPDLLEVGWAIEGDLNGPGVWKKEYKVSPWAELDWDGLAESTMITLEEGGVIGIGYLWKDYDDSSIYEGSFDFPRNHDVWLNADFMADFELLGCDDSFGYDCSNWGEVTAVENDSWGRIKASFK